MLRKLIHKCALGLYVAASLVLLGFVSVTAVQTNHPFFYSAIIVGFLGFITGWSELYLLVRTRQEVASPQDFTQAHVFVFIEQEDFDTARISLLSCKYLKGSPDVSVICSEERFDIQSLCDEFGFAYQVNQFSVETDAQYTLVTNGHTILYPDALMVAQRRFAENISYVELNHSSYSSHALGNDAVNEDASLASLLATSASSYSTLIYTGGPVLSRTDDVIKVMGNEGGSTFADVIASLSSSSLNAVITAHPCCECISHNEIDHNISSRIEKLKVSRRLRTLARKSQLPLRRHIAHFYSRIFWFRSLELILVGAMTIGVVAFHVPMAELLIVFAIIVVAQGARYVCSHLRGDHRRVIERLRDSVLDCEAFIHVIALRMRSRSSSQRYRIRFVPMYMCILLSALAVRFAISSINQTFGSLSFFHSFISLAAGGIVVVVLYKAMYRYLSARQRAFARRSVSITGSSSYESMWIVDLTHRGAAYISDSRFDIGDDTPLVFRVPTMTGDSLITVVGKVTYCGARGDQYQVGVAFKELSQSAQDDLAVYCSVIYPYNVARHIDDTENVSRDLNPMPESKNAIRRDRLSVMTYAFVASCLIGLLLSSVPVGNASESESPAPGRVAAAIPSKYSIDTLIEESGALPTKSNESEIKALAGQFDLSVSQEILNIPLGGFHSGDLVHVRITVLNAGPGASQSGFVVAETLGADFDEKSVVMTNTGGFRPCGFSANKMECVAPSGLAAGESRSIEFSVISFGVHSSESARRGLVAGVEASPNDAKEIASPFVTTSNNVDEKVMPVGNATSIGDQVFFDANANGIHDSGEPGIAGVNVDLLQFQNINGDSEMDPGETPVIAHDVSDARGYFGVSKGTSSFQHLSPGFEYAVKFSGLPKGTTPTARNAGSDVDPTTLISAWTLLGEGVVNTSVDLGVVSVQQDLLTATFIDVNRDGILDKDEQGLDVGEVDLMKWVDINSNEKQDPGEVLDDPVATHASSLDGAIEFTGIRDDIFPTYYATRFVMPNGYDVFDDGAQLKDGRVRSPFVSSKKFNSSKIAFVEKGTTVGGALYVDFNENAREESSEYGQAGIEIRLVSVDEKTILTTSTQRDGSYEFTNVVAGDYFLGVENASMPHEFVVPGFENESLSGKVSGRKDLPVSVAVNTPMTLRDLPIKYHASEVITSKAGNPSLVHHVIRGDFADARITAQEAFRIRVVTLGAVFLCGILVIVTLAARKKLMFRNR